MTEQEHCDKTKEIMKEVTTLLCFLVINFLVWCAVFFWGLLNVGSSKHPFQIAFCVCFVTLLSMIINKNCMCRSEELWKEIETHKL